MSDDLIYRSALLTLYKKWLPQLVSPDDAGDKRGVETCIMVLEDFPAVDAVEVVHGEWIAVPNSGIGNTAKCTHCGKSIYGYKAMNYCPNCGADMRERRTDD